MDASYLGLTLRITELDRENIEFFKYCAAGEFRLQKCKGCGLLRYPPTTGCPWCAEAISEWTAVEGRGEVHSYTEIHHPVQPGFKQHLPYLVLIVELDAQKDMPRKYEALRVVGNLADKFGHLISGSQIERVGIGSRMRMTFANISPDIALPQWTLDATVEQPVPWRSTFVK